jgi:hypothetical protein
MRIGTRSLAGFWMSCLVAAFAALWVGCGGGKASIEGTVTFDGQPVEKGQIVLEPADGKGPVDGGSIENGKYRLAGDAGVAPGKKIVRIDATRGTGRKIESGPPSPPGTTVDEIVHYIPASYGAQSTLTCEVAAGQKNQQDFTLTSK